MAVKLRSKKRRITTPRAAPPTLTGGIVADTSIVPLAVADGVVEEVNQVLGREVLTSAHADRLAEKAEVVYAHSERFRAHLQRKGNAGRDRLYGFMRHWAAALVLDLDPSRQLFRRLPRGYGWSC